MEAVTFPKDYVVEFINANLVPVRLAHDAEPESKDFQVKWTPTLLILDQKGREHHRTVGFLSPEELIPSLMLGIAKGHFENDALEKAVQWLEKVITQHPGSNFTPEAIFLRGVSKYKITHETAPLKAAYEELNSKFPENEWTKRAYPYRLL